MASYDKCDICKNNGYCSRWEHSSGKGCEDYDHDQAMEDFFKNDLGQKTFDVDKKKWI